MDQLIEQLKQQIIELLNLEDTSPEDLDPNVRIFDEGLGLDSIDALEIVSMLEQHYGIRITDLEVGRKAFASLTALAEFIKSEQNKQ